MADNVYKIVELTGSSQESIEEAIRNAVNRAAETVRNIRWIEVLETRGAVEGNDVSYWQVTIKVGFTLED